MDYTFRKAVLSDAQEIWKILKQAIERRKLDGSLQWQDGYPNLAIVEKDISEEAGFVLSENGKIVAYLAAYINYEPAYADIQGKWLTEGDFIAIHRVAVAEEYLGKGLAKQLLQEMESTTISKGIWSLKADTNFDNQAMIHLFEKRGYVYCGEVYFRGSARRAYEKVLTHGSFKDQSG